jgi:hypothetical protein
MIFLQNITQQGGEIGKFFFWGVKMVAFGI